MGELSNDERADYAEDALERYLSQHCRKPDDLTTEIIDLITDLLHLANQNSIDPDMVHRIAMDHFEAEDLV